MRVVFIVGLCSYFAAIGNRTQTAKKILYILTNSEKVSELSAYPYFRIQMLMENSAMVE